MIVAERKPIPEILEMLAGYRRILIAGCNSCVAVCMAGGEKEVGILATALRLARQEAGSSLETVEVVTERQCEHEFVDEIQDQLENCEAVLSMACGVGAQFTADKFPAKRVFPALNTKFFGYVEQQGIWKENCQGCGNCVLELTGAICPVARCSKSLMNGPCGGAQDGKCEVDKEIDCGWIKICERMEGLGKSNSLESILPIKDWRTSRDGGPRKVVREDLLINEE